MGEIKPLGSEKLSGDDKMKRILELTYFQRPVNESKFKSNSELIVEGKNSVFGIVKEKDGYYVKKGINESSLDYIGGMFMKNKNRFHSYSDALKRLEFLKGQEMLNEATKYVLKNNSTSTDTPAPAPAPEQTTPPTDAVPPTDTEQPDLSTDTNPEVGGDESNGNDEFSTDVQGDALKSIQKLTGKLGQKLREFDDEIESNDIKYVINMVLSAVDLEKLEDDDKEEILNKLDGDTEEDGDTEGLDNNEFGGDDMGIPSYEPETEPEDDLGEIYSSLEEFTNTDFDFDDDDETDLDEYFYNPEDEEGEDLSYDNSEYYDSEDEEGERGLGDILNDLEEENVDYGSVSKNKRNHSYSSFDSDLDDILGIGNDESDESDEYNDDTLSLNEIRNLIRKKFRK